MTSPPVQWAPPSLPASTPPSPAVPSPSPPAVVGASSTSRELSRKLRLHRRPHWPPPPLSSGAPVPPPPQPTFTPNDTNDAWAAHTTEHSASTASWWRPFSTEPVGNFEDEETPEIDVPIAWVLLALVCCCVCALRRFRRRTKQRGGGRDDDLDDGEVRLLVQRIRRVVGYELNHGRVEYSCLDEDGAEVTLDRRDLLDGGDVETMVLEYERRYPPPWTPR